jgi:G3E family GTPase
MEIKTPMTIITGSLGSGKTTLLRHILDNFPKKIAILMNEFGEIAIDSKIIKGKNVEMAELAGGCVCCSLIGEFEAAVVEIIEKVKPEYIVLETTGIAEPDALIFDVQESLPMIRLDGIVTIVDADLMLRFPQIGHTTRIQIEDADLIALNKCDLASENELESIEDNLKKINPKAPILRTTHSQLDPELLFGISRKHEPVKPAPHKHQSEFESISIKANQIFQRTPFEGFLNSLENNICRAKGFVNFPEGTFLFNFVNGRWELEAFDHEETALVFIGKKLNKSSILNRLKSCEIRNAL